MYDSINKNIIEILGINKLPIEKQKEAMERLGGIVYQEVMLRVLDTMSNEDKDAFEKLVEKDPNPETLLEFLSSKVPDLEKIINEEAEDLREESAEILSEIGK